MAYFYRGETYNVWETKGISKDREGRLTISETRRDQGELTPQDALTYLGKDEKGLEGLHAFQLADGRRLKGHRNHFDADAPYNVQRRERLAAKDDAKQDEAKPDPDPKPKPETPASKKATATKAVAKKTKSKGASTEKRTTKEATAAKRGPAKLKAMLP